MNSEMHSSMGIGSKDSLKKNKQVKDMKCLGNISKT